MSGAATFELIYHEGQLLDEDQRPQPRPGVYFASEPAMDPSPLFYCPGAANVYSPNQGA